MSTKSLVRGQPDPSFLREETPAPDNNPTGAKVSTAMAPNAAPGQDPSCADGAPLGQVKSLLTFI